MVHSAKSVKRLKDKGHKRERELANHYGAIRIGAVAGALHHRDGSSLQTNDISQAETSGLRRNRKDENC
jgi:hypothetical protein